MPFDLRSELAQYEDGEHGRADAVDVGVAVAAPDEHARRDLVEAELLGKSGGLPVRARTDRPDALRHARLRYEGCRTAPTCAPGSSSIQASSPARGFDGVIEAEWRAGPAQAWYGDPPAN